jgi:hypothetical protein
MGKVGTNQRNSPIRESTNMSPPIGVDKSVALISS